MAGWIWLGVAGWVWLALGVSVLGIGMIALGVWAASGTNISTRRKLASTVASDAGVALVAGAVVGVVIFLATDNLERNLLDAQVRRDNVRFVREVAIQPNLRNKPFAGLDLRGAQLDALDLSGADLRCADLRGADLSYVDLTDAQLFGADLRGADLAPVVWKNTQYDDETDWSPGFKPEDNALRWRGSRTGCPES